MELNARNIMVCEMSAELFRISCKRNYDPKDFLNKLESSEEGQLLYSNKDIDMWLGAEYVMQGIEMEVTIEKGETINPEVMAWIGYLLKCWSLTYPEETLTDILEQAPFDTLVSVYLGYHVMSCEDAILNLKELHAENS